MTVQDQMTRLLVTADLRIEVNGLVADLSGSGRHLVLHTENPAQLWREAAGAEMPDGFSNIGGLKSLGALAQQLSAVGLQVDVTGPRGVVARLGGASPSLLGKLVTGSDQFAPGAPLITVPLLWQRVSRVGQAGLISGVLAAVAAVVFISRRKN
ncbi:hypothetical protein EH165_07295 [Nakamurella antarctica]|uniref:Uncharacterized protein n=1 Tax=Nakamurella antarctica TaxID=1902245 RepID=A0A3G8ZVD3_9ACTN|nr:hypothetical protein [Nakamurella antarctica]AZI57976.1 hypothetical protein EH165_07295 [Nakamurella antarctica]